MKEEKEERSLIEKVARFLPTIEKPTFRQPFNERLKWTGIALAMYLLLSSITVYGVSKTQYEQFRFFEIVFGSKFGSLMTLGIGPIVTGGIILQLLVGSKILDWDMTEEKNRRKFQAWNRFLAVLFCFLEAIAFVLAGALPVFGDIDLKIFVILQLALGGIIVILLDDLVSKYGFGSGVSLFIAAGVCNTIFIRAFSPLTATCSPFQFSTCIPSVGNPPVGLIWNFFANVFAGKSLEAFLAILPLLSTIIVFLIVIYVQNIGVEIPLTFSALRGFGRSWSLKLLYTSNIPVILAAALIANLQLIARFGLTKTNSEYCGLMGCFNEAGNPVSGVVYYLSSPSNFLERLISLSLSSKEILRAITYLIFLTSMSTIFSIFWVNTSGMDAKSVAEQLDSLGLQIPGYRKDPKVIESVLNRYIPNLAFLGGFFVGLLAAFADFIGALGSGMGILLTVMILYNYYEEISSQNLEEAHPIVRKIFGE
jgi:preprotein translocase subunit SecY